MTRVTAYQEKIYFRLHCIIQYQKENKTNKCLSHLIRI
jgi:hypothetical protein